MTPPTVKSLHLEPTNICTLKCAGCARTRFIEQWPKHWRNHSLDIDSLMRFLDLDLENIPVVLCGNYGDPIYHPEFDKLISALKSRGSCIKIITNGSHRQPTWWQSWLDHLDDRDEIIFSIDGIPENFAQYRVNADWSSIESAIEICVGSKARTVWKFIPFAFNQDHIDAAKSLALHKGMDDFFLEPSDRFDHRTESLKPQMHLIGQGIASKESFQSGQSIEIDPKCNTGKQHFISAEGFYAPCCFVADHRFYFKTPFGKHKTYFDIKDRTLTQLLTSPKTVDFFSQIETHSHDVCKYSCPKRSLDQ